MRTGLEHGAKSFTRIEDRQLLDVANVPKNMSKTVQTEPTDIPIVYQKVLDLLIKRPTPEEIIAFKVSPQAQSRLEELLGRNRSATLNSMELAEEPMFTNS